MTGRMAGRTVLLTGVTRGLGRALAAEFIGRGHRVLGCGRSEAALAELRDAHPEHDFAAVDVADAAAVGAWAARLRAEGEIPDLLINNAGILNPPQPVWQIDPAQMSRLVDINLKGTLHVIHHFVPALIAAGRGVIVNVSSGWGRSVSPGVATYCASKWAIEGLTKALAAELPKGLAVVAWNPGIIDTAMLRQAWQERAGSFETPEQWAPQAAEALLGFGPRDNGRSA